MYILQQYKWCKQWCGHPNISLIVFHYGPALTQCSHELNVMILIFSEIQISSLYMYISCMVYTDESTLLSKIDVLYVNIYLFLLQWTHPQYLNGLCLDNKFRIHVGADMYVHCIIDIKQVNKEKYEQNKRNWWEMLKRLIRCKGPFY